MSFFVNASQEEAFHLVMDYFTGRHFKVHTSNPPSYIKAEFGSWISFETSGNAKGEVEANLVKRNSGSYINLDLSFGKEYITNAMMLVVAVSVTLVIFDGLGFDFPFILSMLLFEVAILLGFVGYAVSKTRRRIIEEFNMFIQSLASKKD